MAVTVGILKESATFYTIRVLYTVQHIASREMHRPFQCEVCAVAYLILYASTYGEVKGDFCLLGFCKRDSHPYIYIR